MGSRGAITDSVKRRIPDSLKPFLRRVYRFTNDQLELMSEQIELLSGRRDALTPPKRMWGMVGDPKVFKEVGRAFVGLLVERCELKPHDKVLDVGCGIGRHAVPLTSYLDQQGRYEGFDIVASGIRWCQKNISRRHPNFRFHVADIYNKTYNPEGKISASEYRFPYDDETFDLVYLTSVFTHMLPADVEHYVAEIARVLKRGGRFAISFYLLNDKARENIAAGSSVFDFAVEADGCYAQRVGEAEAAVAYEEQRVRELFGRYGLGIVEPILYGTWSREKEQSQDIVIGVKQS